MKLILLASALTLSGAAIAQTTPEVDARGIPVVSAPASAPAGANEAVTVQPGAKVVPATNQAAVFATQSSTTDYPPCTKEMTDNCVQTYERGVSPD